MKRVLILVEGQTEETFVKRVLAPHLTSFDMWPEATRVCTKRIEGRRAHRGGGLRYDRVKLDLGKLLASSPDVVTTLFDYYALPDDFPGVSTLPKRGSCFQRVEHIEREMGRDINDPRFVPNLVLHEIEALLFSEPNVIAEVVLDPSAAKALAAIAAAHASPEEIDQGAETHPSKQIERLLPAYQKAIHGPLIAERIGLAKIRASCRHFDAWMKRIEDTSA